MSSRKIVACKEKIQQNVLQINSTTTYCITKAKRWGMTMIDEEKWEVVITASGMTQANIIIGRLTTEDIPTRVKYDAAGTIYAITIDGLGEVKVLVPATALQKARSILSQSYDESELNWDGGTDP
jgi:hypothetical protein